MTVWIVNPFDNLPSEGCRAQRYFLMARAFARSGAHVRLWSSDFSHARKAPRTLDGAAERDGVAFTLIPTRPYAKNVSLARLRSHRALARTFTRLARARLTHETPDLVIASAPPLALATAAQEIARQVRARFVCDIQDAWPETFYRLLPRPLTFLGALLFGPLHRTARRLYRTADRVTGVSKRYATLSGRDDFFLAYHGIEGDCTPHARTTKTRLVYIGNLGEGYVLEPILSALTKRPNLTLDIAGLGPRLAPLRQKVTSLGLTARVTFHGYLGDAALRTLLAASDVGLVPMRDDSFVGLPYKICDYLLAGLSVLSSLHGEAGNLLRETGFGETYDLLSCNSFLDALDRLSCRPVTLPDALKAETIYRDYVSFVTKGL